MSRHNRRGGGQRPASEIEVTGLPGDILEGDALDDDGISEELTAADLAGAATQPASPTPASPNAGPTAAEAVPDQFGDPVLRGERLGIEPPRGLVVGGRLRCDHFEGNVAIDAEVREIREEGSQALLWIPALGRSWPIQAQHVHGDVWVHDAGDYPPPGENEDFDREFRPPVPEQKPDAPAAVAADFAPPRRARGGHIWAVTRFRVGAAGFDVSGAARKDWPPNTAGEFRKRDVEQAPGAFREL